MCYGNETRCVEPTLQICFFTAKTLPSRPGMQIPPPPSAAPQVQAVYTFAATVETQLGFNEGDILVLLGEKSEGWQYGLNTKTGR